jgi:hypothetical protein
MKPAADRRHGQDSVHPARRDDDKPTIQPEIEDDSATASATSGAYEPTDDTAAISRSESQIVPPDTGIMQRPVIEAEPEPPAPESETDGDQPEPPAT